MNRPRTKVSTWDPFLRIFHWSLLLFFSIAYWLEGAWPQLHSHAGYTVVLLVIFRLVWGVVGPEHARFRSFMASPTAAWHYLRKLVRRQAKAHTGHDPAGAWMILALLALLSTTAVSGLLLFAMEGSGPLVVLPVAALPGGTLEFIHGLAADVTLALVAVHVAGVTLASFAHRQNLIAAMITGKKSSLQEPADAP